jgi:hypothetical protein
VSFLLRISRLIIPLTASFRAAASSSMRSKRDLLFAGVWVGRPISPDSHCSTQLALLAFFFSPAL